VRVCVCESVHVRVCMCDDVHGGCEGMVCMCGCEEWDIIMQCNETPLPSYSVM